MEKKIKNDMETGIAQGFLGMWVSHNEGYYLGVPMVRIMVFGVLFWGPPFWETTKCSWDCQKTAVESRVPFKDLNYGSFTKLFSMVLKGDEILV